MNEWHLGILLRNLVEAMAVQAEIESMKVANACRESGGFAQAYPEESFQEKADHLWAISNQILDSIR